VAWSAPATARAGDQGVTITRQPVANADRKGWIRPDTSGLPASFVHLQRRPASCVPRLARHDEGRLADPHARDADDATFSGPRWSGNIHELQNIIERSVVVCDTETLTVDERWLLGPTGFRATPGLALVSYSSSDDGRQLTAHPRRRTAARGGLGAVLVRHGRPGGMCHPGVTGDGVKLVVSGGRWPVPHGVSRRSTTLFDWQRRNVTPAGAASRREPWAGGGRSQRPSEAGAIADELASGSPA